MDVYDRFPSGIIRPRSMTAPFLKPMTQTGPRTYDGRSQSSGPDAGYWIMELGVELAREYQVMEWRGFTTARQGPLNPFVIGIFDDQHAPRVGANLLVTGIPHRDGSTFSDGSGYAQSTILVKLRTPLTEGDTTASLEIVNAGLIRRGMFFSIDNRLSMIIRPPDIVSPTRVDIVMLPPSRISKPAGTEIELARPTLLAKFSDPMAGRMQVRPPYVAEASITLEESFHGLP